jgi:seryl-tRNA synthetase
MKLNFMNVLNKKSTPDEIVEQIIILEKKQRQYQKEYDEAKEKVKEIRSRAICDEKISPDKVTQADKRFDEAKINLEIVSESIDKLKAKLYEALTALHEEETRNVVMERRVLNSKRSKAELEFWREKGRLFGMAIAIYGHPEIARRRLEEHPSFSPALGSEQYDIYHAAKDRALAEVNKPTVADIEKDIDSKENWVRNFDLEEEIAKLMKRYGVEDSLAKDLLESVAD